MRKKIYIEVCHDDEKNAGSKAVNDITEIAGRLGFEKYRLNINTNKYGLLNLPYKYFQLRKLLSLPENAVVLIPHPLYTSGKYMTFLSRVKEKKNLKLIFLINDLESLRNLFPEQNEKFTYVDNTMYRIADGIIAHNAKMKEYLIEQGVNEEKIVILDLFDYLKEDNEKEVFFEKSVNVAGNLDPEKCGYLKELPQVVHSEVRLYGTHYSEIYDRYPNVRYMGAFPADRIAEVLDHGFGLVWDGTSASGCTGNTGDYLKYNNPHKLSLYIAAGLPVIIWEKAAQAEFVKREKIGFCVASLDEIDAVLEKVGKEEYEEYRSHIRNLRTKAVNGGFAEEGIRAALKITGGE